MTQTASHARGPRIRVSESFAPLGVRTRGSVSLEHLWAGGTLRRGRASEDHLPKMLKMSQEIVNA